MKAERNECLGQFNEGSKLNLPECRLETNSNITVKQKNGQAYSLNAKNLPRFDGSKDSLLDIIDFLDVEKSARYTPTRNSTYCNIYAHDYADLMNCFLPRTWWTDEAIKHQKFAPIYGKTCKELNANAIYDWFDKYGSLFGWRKLEGTTEAQQEANKNKCVIMIAANKNRRKSGHVVAVVPEHEDKHATGAKGIVIYPLQSQAGRVNRKFFSKKWWSGMEKLRIYVND